MMDPRFFLGIGGPTPNQPMLQPGFRPPGPGPGAPMMQMPQQQAGMPGMGGLGGLAGLMKPGMQPSTSGATMGAAENDGLAGAIAGIQGLQPGADGTYAQPPMPTDIGSGMGGGGSFMNWLRGLGSRLF